MFNNSSYMYIMVLSVLEIDGSAELQMIVAAIYKPL